MAVISESAFSAKGHGVHTAFVETTNALKKCQHVDVMVNSFRRADVRHIHTTGLYSLAHLFFGSGKKVVSAHLVPESLVGSIVGAEKMLSLIRWYLRFFYNHADNIVAVSESTEETLRDMGVTAPIDVVHNMIDVSRYQGEIDTKSLRAQLNIAPEAPVVVANGQVQPRKRFDSFLAIARQMSDCHFVWIGGIPFKNAAAEYAEMRRLIASAPPNVTVTGVIDLDEVPNYYALGNVFIMTSDQETFGLAVVEAAATGLPIVLRDIHDYDATFRAYALMSNEESFAADVRQLIDDEALRSQYIARAKQLADTYDSQNVVRNLLAVYAR